MSNDPYLYDSYEHKGVEIEIRTEECPESPREMYENAGTMVFLHDWNTKDYTLGDEHLRLAPDELMVPCSACRGEKYFRNDRECQVCDYNGEVAADVVAWAKHTYDAVLVVPIYFSDMRYNGDCRVCDVEDANGFIYLTREKLTEEWGRGSNAFRKARKYLETEVETYGSYCRNEVFGWVATLGAESESCWGYYGEEDYVREEAERAAESLLEQANKENIERQFWIEREVVTV